MGPITATVTSELEHFSRQSRTLYTSGNISTMVQDRHVVTTDH